MWPTYTPPGLNEIEECILVHRSSEAGLFCLVQALWEFLSEARQKTVEISLIPCTSKLGLRALLDYPNEEPGACAELSLINLNLGVHLPIVPIKIP